MMMMILQSALCATTLSMMSMTQVESFAFLVPQATTTVTGQRYASATPTTVMQSTAAVSTADDIDVVASPSSGAVARIVSETSCGTVHPSVEMNDYNLDSLNTILNEWTAEMRQANALQDTGVYLGAKSDKEIFVDEVRVEIPRIEGQGLGIELLELYGGREDGVGITLVEGLVEGGLSQESGLLPGDSISQIDVVVKSSSSGTEDREEITSVSTECLDYDRTIDAIVSLPPPSSSAEQENYVLTAKRLRRKPKVVLNLQYPPNQQEGDVRLELFAGENLRRAMLARGVKLNDKLAERFDNGGTGDCGADGTCCTCAVEVVGGNIDNVLPISPLSTMETQVFKTKPRWRLACKAIVGPGMTSGELTVRVNPRQWD